MKSSFSKWFLWWTNGPLTAHVCIVISSYDLHVHRFGKGKKSHQPPPFGIIQLRSEADAAISRNLVPSVGVCNREKAHM